MRAKRKWHRAAHPHDQCHCRTAKARASRAADEDRFIAQPGCSAMCRRGAHNRCNISDHIAITHKLLPTLGGDFCDSVTDSGLTVTMHCYVVAMLTMTATRFTAAVGTVVVLYSWEMERVWQLGVRSGLA